MYFFYSVLSIRLANGSNSHEGRVELFYQGAWGTICDDGWDINDANVVCRMLGYPKALNVTVGSANQKVAGRFGAGSGDIILDDLSCTGIEDNIGSCKHGRRYKEHNCVHNEDAGVICDRGKKPAIVSRIIFIFTNLNRFKN